MKITKTQLRQLIKEQVEKYDWEDEDGPSSRKISIVGKESLEDEINRIENLRKKPPRGLNIFYDLESPKLHQAFNEFLQTKNLEYNLEKKSQQNLFKNWVSLKYTPVVITYLKKFNKNLAITKNNIAKAIGEDVLEFLDYEGYNGYS